MKLFRPFALLLIFLPVTVLAQTDENSVNIADMQGRKVLSIAPTAGDDNGFSLSISGFEIGFNIPKGQDGPKEKHEFLDPVLPGKRMRDVNTKYRTVLPLIEFGFTTFAENDYKAYTPDHSGFMKHKWSGSTHIQWNVLRFSESFNRMNTIGFNSALGLAWDNYAFSNYLIDNVGETGSKGQIRHIGRSNIRTFSLNIPIVFGYNHKGFGVGLGVYGNFVLSRKSKILNHRSFREMMKPYVNKPQAGATLRLKFKSVSLFANYTFTNVFESGTAPDARAITFGIGIW